MMTQIVRFALINRRPSGFFFSDPFFRGTYNGGFKVYKSIGGRPDEFIEPLETCDIFDDSVEDKYALMILRDDWFTKIKK